MLKPSNETVFYLLIQAFSSYPTVTEAMHAYKANIIANPEHLINGIRELQCSTPVLDDALILLHQLYAQQKPETQENIPLLSSSAI